MENFVTVVPDDKVIIVNGIGYVIDMDYPTDTHAIQWAGESGHIEFKDERHNTPISADDYAEHVQPYVDAWQAAYAAATAPPPQPTLDEVAAGKLATIQAEKCRVRDGGFLVGETLFDSDQAARTSYLELALRFQIEPGFSTRWKASSGVWVTMDATLFSQVQAAGTAHIQAVFAWQEARDAEVAAILAQVAAGTMTEMDARVAVEAVSTTYDQGGGA